MKQIFVGVLICGAVFFMILWLFGFFVSEEEKIKSRLSEVAQALRIESRQNPIVFAAQVNAMEKLFDPEMLVKVKVGHYPEAHLASWNELKEKMIYARGFLEFLNLEFKDSSIKILDSTADVHLTIVIEGKAKQGQEKFLEASEARILMNKSKENGWQMKSLENIETVRFR